MKAVFPNGKNPPCLIYWTGRVRLHVGILTWCGESQDASDGVLQVADDTECCTKCEEAVREHRYPQRRP